MRDHPAFCTRQLTINMFHSSWHNLQARSYFHRNFRRSQQWKFCRLLHPARPRRHLKIGRYRTKIWTILLKYYCGHISLLCKVVISWAIKNTVWLTLFTYSARKTTILGCIWVTFTLLSNVFFTEFGFHYIYTIFSCKMVVLEKFIQMWIYSANRITLTRS